MSPGGTLASGSLQKLGLSHPAHRPSEHLYCDSSQLLWARSWRTLPPRWLPGPFTLKRPRLSRGCGR